MNIKTIRRVIETLQASNERQSKFLEKLPRGFGEALFDNTYVDAFIETQAFLLEELLGEELFDEVSWFLYDWAPGYDIVSQQSSYKIENLEDFIKYLKAEYAELS